jgi:hypothetical protein
MYKLNKNQSGEVCSIKKDTGLGILVLIPLDPDNTDYQEYLKWVAEGNEPAPPDEPESP